MRSRQFLPPTKWSPEELDIDRKHSIEIFKEYRLREPIEAYGEAFETVQARFEDLLEQTVDLTQLREQAVEILTDSKYLECFRYLSSPRVSEDDLMIIADASSIAPKVLRGNPDVVDRLVETIWSSIDRRRFPWVGDSREPSEAERHAAIIATASLMATQRIETNRRNESKAEQEEAVRVALSEIGFIEVDRRTVKRTSDAPEAGQFCLEAHLGDRQADLIVRLQDSRIMPIECKVSNSYVNSVKRLNNDAAVKATYWIKEFGESGAVPVAVLSGVFKLAKLTRAQDANLSLYWAHNLQALVDWVKQAV